MLDRYRPSGRTGPAVFVLWLPLLLVLCGLAWIYQLLIDWIPFIYLNFLLTLGFAGAAFFGTAWETQFNLRARVRRCLTLYVARRWRACSGTARFPLHAAVPPCRHPRLGGGVVSRYA